MSSSYRLRPLQDEQEWQRCFELVDKPHFTQAFFYGQAKHDSGRWQLSRWLFEQGGSPVAMCQILEKRLAGRRLAARINRGPLFLDPAPSYECREQVFALLRQQWKWGLGGLLLIAPALAPTDENRYLLRQTGFRDRKIAGWQSSLIDLSLDDRDLQRQLAPTWRNRLRASLQCGLQLQISNSADSVAWMLARHQKNMRDKHFHGPSKQFLAALYAASPADFVVLTAVADGAAAGAVAGEAVAGVVISRFGQSAEYFVGWFGDAGRKLNCGNFLYWHSILYMKQANCRWFDLGGYSVSDRYGRFKQNMRGAEYRLIGEWLAY